MMSASQQWVPLPYHSKEPDGSSSEVSSVIPVYNAIMYYAVRDRGEITRQRQKWAATHAYLNSRNSAPRRMYV